MSRILQLKILFKKQAWLIAVMLYAFAVAIRLYQIVPPAPQPDEAHWVERSNTLLRRLHDGQYSVVTHHLGHPGIIPAAVMALGQQHAPTLAQLPLLGGGNIRADKLSGSRIANALVSSLLIPLLFLFSRSLIGVGLAAGLAAFVALDPHHIALSRMAHLDSLLTLLVTITWMSYWQSIRHGDDARWKMLAGFFWGLSIATKPTAVFLVPAFVLFRAISRIRSKTLPVLLWSDVWAVVFGQTVFAAMYSRFWVHESDYMIRLGIVSRLADFLYKVGFSLQQHGAVVVGSLLVLCCSALCFQRRSVKLGKFLQPICISCFLVLALTAFPEVVENIVRFWTWVFGLSGEKHKAFGQVWAPPRYGYWGMIVYQLPTWLNLGLLLIFASLLARRKFFATESETRPLVIFCFLLFLCWILPLSTSAKQTLRYLMPIVPVLYLIVLALLFRVVLPGWKSSWSVLGKKNFNLTICLLLFVLQSWQTLRWYPHYFLYFSTLSGGLPAAVARQQSLPFAGENEAFEFLASAAKQKGEPLQVNVPGDPLLLRSSYARFATEHPEVKGQVKFLPVMNVAAVEYLLLLGSFQVAQGPLLSAVAGVQPLFEFRFHDVRLLSVYRLPPMEFREPFPINLLQAANQTGGHDKYRGTQRLTKESDRRQLNRRNVIVARRGLRAPSGYLSFGQEARIPEGEFRLKFRAGVPRQAKSWKQIPADQPVLRFDFGTDCSRTVKRGELSSTKMKDFEVVCAWNKEARHTIRVYWHGEVPVVLESVAHLQRGSS